MGMQQTNQKQMQDWMNKNKKVENVRRKRNSAMQLALWASLPVGYLVCENPDLFSGLGKINISYENNASPDKPAEPTKPENPNEPTPPVQDTNLNASAQDIKTDTPPATDTPTGDDIVKDPGTDTGLNQTNADGGDSGLRDDRIAAVALLAFIALAMIYALKKTSDLRKEEKELQSFENQNSAPTT